MKGNETLEKLHHEVKINAHLDKVWQTIIDLESVRFYNPLVEAVRYTSHNREGIGASRRCDFKDGTSVEEKVIEYEPKRSISFEAYNHKLPLEFFRWTIKVERSGEGTQITSDADYAPKVDVLSSQNMDASMLRHQFDKIIADTLELLKLYVETGKTHQQITR